MNNARDPKTLSRWNPPKPRQSPDQDMRPGSCLNLAHQARRSSLDELVGPSRYSHKQAPGTDSSSRESEDPNKIQRTDPKESRAGYLPLSPEVLRLKNRL